MPVHDWTRVSAGTFHHFHGSWIIHLSEALNAGVLPDSYYAMSEQHAGQIIPDVLTLERRELESDISRHPGAVAVAEAPPATQMRQSLDSETSYRRRQKTLSIRETGSDRLVAIVEIVSPSNKDRAQSVQDLVEKLHSALRARVHVLLLDLIPPGTHDPHGIHGAVCDRYDLEYSQPAELPLTMASYAADRKPTAYVEPVSVGQALIDMPLFLDVDWYVPAPLEATYLQAYRGMPSVWKEVLDPTA
jgi:hypothetical protein